LHTNLQARGARPLQSTRHEKTVNILNCGTSTIKPRRFATKAIKALKGLDDRAAVRRVEKAKKLGEYVCESIGKKGRI
jgi:hypothetical protein